MRRLFLSSFAALLLAALFATPALATPWVRGYVVTAYEPAWHYGSSANFHKADLIEPGSDCPKGSYPQLDWEHVLLTPWRDAKAVAGINHPPHTDLTIIHYVQYYALTYRGFREGIDVYINPFSTPDPGIQPVTGKIAEGFDLDNNPRTGGFTDRDGRRGIDNNYYRAWGCIAAFRGAPYHATMSMRATDKMLEGLYTFVIRVSGNKDPMNDDDATVEVGPSPDHVFKTSSGSVLSDYSFRIAKNGEYTKLKATVKNGVVETEQVDELHAPRFSWFPNQYGDADFHKGRLRLVMDADGNASGLLGGYRDWRQLWVEDHFAQAGSIDECRDHQNSMGMYYAIKRNADGMPDPKTGVMTGISIAYRFQAKPAFVIDPAKPPPPIIATSPNVEWDIKLFQAHRDAFLKAIATRQIQPLPPGSREGIGTVIVMLPQLQSDGSWKVIRPASPTSPNTDIKPEQQVQNGNATQVRSIVTR